MRLGQKKVWAVDIFIFDMTCSAPLGRGRLSLVTIKEITKYFYIHEIYLHVREYLHQKVYLCGSHCERQFLPSSGWLGWTLMERWLLTRYLLWQHLECLGPAWEQRRLSRYDYCYLARVIDLNPTRHRRFKARIPVSIASRVTYGGARGGGVGRGLLLPRRNIGISHIYIHPYLAYTSFQV